MLLLLQILVNVNVLYICTAHLLVTNAIIQYTNILGLYEKAESLYMDCLQRRRVTLGDDHPDTLLSMNNLAWLYNNQGNLQASVHNVIKCNSN